MHFVRVSLTLFYFAITENRAMHLQWIDSLIDYIVKNTTTRQVILTSNLALNACFESRIIDELSVKIMKNIPTVRMNMLGLEDPRSNRPFIDIDKNFAVTDTSESFFIHIHESRESLGFLPTEKTIDAVKRMSAMKMRSRFLLVVVSPFRRDDFKEFLAYAWTKLLLDFTLLETIEEREVRKLICIDCYDTTTIVHQLNLFKKEYTRKNWTSEIEWFPDKVRNMWGHQMKIGVSNNPPFTLLKVVAHPPSISVGGANIDLIKIMAEVLNFSLYYEQRYNEFMEIYVNPNPIGLYKLLQTGKVDIMPYLSPHHTDDPTFNTQRSAMVRLDKLCPVVPILPRVAVPFPMNFFQAYLVTFLIVALFSILKRLLRFKGKLWQSFNILRVLMGVSVGPMPSNISERLLFSCLLLVSAIYLSTIYVALTNISLHMNAEMEFQSFEDLVASKLTPMIASYVYNKTFLGADGPMLELQKRIIIYLGSMHECAKIAADYKNVTCLMSQQDAKVLVRQINRSQGRSIKVARPCFWSDSTGFLLRLGSPWRSRINGIIGRLQSSGLLEKLFNDPFDVSQTVSIERNDGLDIKENMKSLRQQLLAIAIVGYSLSLLAFVAEVLVDRVMKYKRSAKTKEIGKRLSNEASMFHREIDRFNSR